MTNADYYVNVYRSGWLGGENRSRADADKNVLFDPVSKAMEGNRIGVWHVRLKDNCRDGTGNV